MAMKQLAEKCTGTSAESAPCGRPLDDRQVWKLPAGGEVKLRRFACPMCQGVTPSVPWCELRLCCAAAGLELPPETNSADWVLDMTVQDGKALTEAYRQRKAGALAVRQNV